MKKVMMMMLMALLLLLTVAFAGCQCNTENDMTSHIERWEMRPAGVHVPVYER